MKSSTTNTYYSRLDHLRFVAAFLVLAWHGLHNSGIVPTSDVPSFPPLSLLEEGHTGVALFMTLSGFIFYTLCRGKRIDYREFMRNRLLRIAPLFVVWIGFDFYTLNLDPARLFVALFGLMNNGVVPGVGWTVIVECQFYVIFPFLFLFSQRYGVRYLAGLVALAVLFRAGVWYSQGSVQTLAYPTLFGRIDQFLLGMISSELFFRYRGFLGRLPVLIVLIAAWTLIFHRFNALGGYWNNGGVPSPSPVWVILSTLEGVFYGLITASYLALDLPLPAMIDRFLAWLGTLSYSFYLNHLFLLAAAAKLCAQLGWHMNGMTDGLLFTFGVGLPLVTFVSALTYRYIEAPFLTLRRPYLTHQAAPEEPAGQQSENGVARLDPALKARRIAPQ